jgi:hypothetical protein
VSLNDFTTKYQIPSRIAVALQARREGYGSWDVTVFRNPGIQYFCGITEINCKAAEGILDYD